MLHRSKLLALILISYFGFTGCAITTMYGKKPMPVQGENDAYRFTIYYNMYTSKKDIEKRSHEAAEKLLAENDCKDYTLKEIPNNTFGAQDVDFIAYLNC